MRREVGQVNIQRGIGDLDLPREQQHRSHQQED